MPKDNIIDMPTKDTNNMPTRRSAVNIPVKDKIIYVGNDDDPYKLHRYLLKPILVAGTTQLLVAPPKAGKSFVAVELAWAVASGLPFLSQYPVRTPGSVLYIAGEGSGETRARFEVLIRTRGKEQLKHHIMIYPEPPQLSRVGIVSPFVEFCDERDVVLVIIDTASRCGAGDEESGSMVAFVDGLRELQECKATLLVLHHSPKSDSRQSRGHSSLPAAVDSMWTVQAKADGTRTLQEEFGRTASSKEALLGTFKIKNHILGTNIDGDNIGAGYVEVLKTVSTPDRNVDIHKMSKRGLSIRAIAAEVGISKSMVQKVLDDEDC